jgi:cyclic beta-1,2-glucan synthetase
MGGGDWNDGMNRVGHEGKGESVWLAWFLVDNLNAFTKIAEARGDTKRAQVWSEHVSNIKIAIEKEAWDGSWYRRAFYDDGSSLGSSENLECRIDSLAQTWSAISGAGEHSRIMDAMNSVEKYLIKKSDKMILLFSPPFDKTTSDPGYIKGYVPGIRENGGQYSHAAIWCVYAYTRLNQGQKAVETFSMLNPINHAKNLSEVLKYKVEPYVIAADIYSQEPHLGRGGWTWYTGSAAWLYRAGIEEILGFQQRGNKIFITPHIDPSWNKFTITYKYFNSIYKFEIKNPKHLSYGISKYWVDDKPIEKNQDGILLVNDGLEHIVVVELL